MIIKLDDLSIEVSLIVKPKNRRIYFRIKNNILVITSFKKLNEKQIKSLISNNKDIVIRMLNNNITLNDKLYYLGKLYDLKIIQSNINDCRLELENIVVYVKKLDEALIKKTIRRFYVEALEDYIEDIFDDIFKRFSDLNIKRPNLIYTYRQSYYGKCFMKKNTIEFSGICMKLEPNAIECVICHELSHFKYKGHKKDFYDYFISKFKNARLVQRQMKSKKYKDKY